MGINLLRAILGLIPGIGGLFLLAIAFDYTKMSHWKYWAIGIMIIHCAYLIIIFCKY